MRNVFISYHHANDQWAKNKLQEWAAMFDLFNDVSVDTGNIDDGLPTDRIREVIRDDYLRSSTVTLVLVGTETKGRKHVDWEIYSSMYDGLINKKSGIVVIQLPSTAPTYFTAAHEVEKQSIYPDCSSWTSITDRAEYERRYPYLPARIIDNLLEPKAPVSVAMWSRIEANPLHLATLIEAAYDGRAGSEYDLSRPMRTSNSPIFI
jgi:hypothetical protein